MSMEEKELNLCELLKDCIGETFYSPIFGECKLREIYKDNNNGCQPLINVTLADGDTRNIASTGHLSWNVRKHGNVIFYPHKELYLQYPLDPQRAWSIWQEQRKPKYKLEVHYEIIYGCCHGCGRIPTFEFKTEEETKEAIAEVKKCLEEFHKKHSNE